MRVLILCHTFCTLTFFLSFSLHHFLQLFFVSTIITLLVESLLEANWSHHPPRQSRQRLTGASSKCCRKSQLHAQPHIASSSQPPIHMLVHDDFPANIYSGDILSSLANGGRPQPSGSHHLPSLQVFPQVSKHFFLILPTRC